MHIEDNLFLPRPLPEGKGRGQHAVFRLQVRVLVEMPKNMSCDWSMRFMRVILLEFPLVRTRSVL